MANSDNFKWSYAGLQFQGISLAGIFTSMTMPELSLAFDVAQGYPFALNLKHYFITHGHLDHAAGIPYIISQKAMASHAPPHFYMPASLVEPMKQIMKAWSEIEKHEYQFHFHEILGSEKIELNRNHFVRPFQTVHRIDSFGYTVFQQRLKLKNQYLTISQAELDVVRGLGHEITENIETPLVSFTGDTQIEFLDRADWIKKSKVLFIEATYLDSTKSIASAREWGHTHLDEIILRLKDLACEKIVIIHVSSRYSNAEAQAILAEKIPQADRERVILFPGRSLNL